MRGHTSCCPCVCVLRAATPRVKKINSQTSSQKLGKSIKQLTVRGCLCCCRRYCRCCFLLLRMRHVCLLHLSSPSSLLTRSVDDGWLCCLSAWRLQLAIKRMSRWPMVISHRQALAVQRALSEQQQQVAKSTKPNPNMIALKVFVSFS